jgi:predicted ATPase
MLTEFSIGNYQAFSTPQRVPLKPITLIFGPNSAGKSSLLRSLLVARHAILNGKLSKSEGAGERHPGSYADMVRNGSSNPITFGFSVQPTGKSQEEALYLELSWKEKEGAGLETTAWALKQKQAELAAYSTRWNSKHLQISNLGDELSQIIQAANLEIAEPGSETQSSLSEMAQESIKRRLALQKNVPLPGTDADQFRTEDSKKDEIDLLTIFYETHKQKELKERALGLMRQIEAAIASLKAAITTPFKLVDASLREDLSKLIYHGPIRPICDEITKARQAEPGMMEWWSLAAEPELLAKVNHWLADDIFKTKYRLEFDRLFPDSSLRQILRTLSGEQDFKEMVEAAYEAKLNSDKAFYGSEIDSKVSDIEGCEMERSDEDEDERKSRLRSMAHDILYDDARRRGMDHYISLLTDNDVDEIESFLLGGLNQTLANLRAMLESVRQGRGSKTPGGFDSAKVRFSSTTSSQSVSPSNMGIGFSQMMPLVASAFGAENSLIAIEQPELHVHPALQTELADLFIQSAKGRGNRFLIETHSEHLILRVMRRIRETTRNSLPEGKPPIKPKDVAILYVQPGENGSTVQELRIDEQGRFVDNWPQGFFEERLDEMF